jgi:ankyrin repeat protein
LFDGIKYFYSEPDGRTILHVAVASGDFEKVERLLQNHNTDMLSARDEKGWQAIHEAARRGFLDILKLVII